jgi:hypothetical protein
LLNASSNPHLERPWKPSAHSQKVQIKMFRPLQKNSFRNTVPLISISSGEHSLSLHALPVFLHFCDLYVFCFC